ncbi:LOW QUALITY PROTEIN: uncharacterized protein LOC115444067 [Manduca sexta]|uniref:LOW QUALITY PROTEIN: uncharacterized protein LOC115444067 n=1 Tax=Manduca sexta TaxID=7130 RepID=UPI00188FF17A|nr:LOW QUALITY PROTEIN: uncharacterized protein LOC115444067 [Manduca sexta]
MAIPPFPSQDLAKLVLGYLAEEQLMTAYDEFLQASPYLDAMRNEYDRIFMTSLKNVLAEYRAVKIYVETCKPLTLRRKLFRCVNLLEIIKFLIDNVDYNKLLAQDIAEKNSLDKQNITLQTAQCEICNSLKLPNCTCKGQPNTWNASNIENASQAEESTLQNSIETTALTDLPGNHGNLGKSQAKRSNKRNTTIPSNVTPTQNDLSVKQPKSAKNKNAPGHLKVANCSKMGINSNVQPTCVTGSISNIPECNNIHLAKNNSGVFNRYNSISDNKGISSASTFQDFASGVQAGCEKRCVTVPDSSTSENMVFQSPALNNDISKHRETSKSQIVFKMESINKNIQPQPKPSVATVCATYCKIKPKTDEQRIRILSDIKVDNVINSNERKLIPVLRNATSTPLLQTLVINGTPAYRPHPVNMQQQSFTKDEIMAMPTIIVVPASDPSQLSTNMKVCSVTSQSSNIISVPTSRTEKVLSPLVVDVSSNSSEENDKKEETAKEAETAVNEVGLIKTVDIAAQPKMTSMPKDGVKACTAETSTPMVFPPLRKSSSTPRRTSHVRVLDFTTPRRVLHETIIEQDSVQHFVLSQNIGTVLSEQVDFALNENNKQIANVLNVTTKPANDNKETVTYTKGNWDHDLRAMIEKDKEVLSKVKTKQKTKTTKKKKDDKKKTAEKDVSEKNKRRKSKRKLEEEDEPDLTIKPDAIPVKPTINIKPAAERGSVLTSTTKKEVENCNVKCIDEESKHNEERTDTPEVDRIALQNAIGAKLNISDLLETPYKQVFYDIQMETPRCLGPDMPDEPMSDIKIMNIPTPRFFDSPKITQATPSSYSSRPTDYSSGGSYYKPDDQDYLPVPEFKCPVTSSKADENVDLVKDKSKDKRTTRPVRQCAKNVSYFTSTKIRDGDDKTDVDSICSASSNTDNMQDRVVDKDKTIKVNKANETSKVERSKRGIKKKKSPAVKPKPKTFMKIKPRRITPTKENLSGKSRKRTLQSSSPKLPRKRTSSKDKNINVTPIITSVPAKSRRKSSTPRKLHCSKTFNSENSEHNSPETLSDKKLQNVTRDTNSLNTQDSDTEQLNLRWSDDGSQDAKTSEVPKNVSESEDISQIQEYIKTTLANVNAKESSSVLQTHLVRRGFDEETAKTIEKDLLDTPPPKDQIIHEMILSDKSIDTDSSINNELQIVPDNIDGDEEIELSVHESNEESNNWCSVTFKGDDETIYPNQQPLAKLKDTFSMEVCIEDGIAIRLRATPFNSLFDIEAGQEDRVICDKEMRDAVESISNIEKLYTPLKDPIRAQCYEIFDSTLTSLDTPLKVSSPRRYSHEITTAEIILEEEKPEIKDNEKIEFKKRKRKNCIDSDDSSNESKKIKPDAQYLLASTNIRNIDIETVLTKLHGP